MGWNSWNAFSDAVTAADVRETADAMVETGLADAGYEYVVVDDCWMADDLGPNGEFRPHPEDFPDGIGPLADYVHDRGLQFGIYSSAGTTTCEGYPGSLGRERVHAEQFDEWGVDYLKYDNCGEHRGRDHLSRFGAMGEALRAVDRDVVYSVCEWGSYDPWLWGRNVGGDLWRTTTDIVLRWRTDDDEFGLGVADIVDRMAELDVAAYHGPGGWHDPDMLQVGNDPSSGHAEFVDTETPRGFTDAEARTHFSFWCLFAAPLMVGTDLREMDAATRGILTNEAAIAVNQDPLGIQGTPDRRAGDREVWSKRLIEEECAVLLFNRDEKRATVAADVAETDLPVTADRYRVRDLWTGEEWRTGGAIEREVPPHGVAFLRVAAA